jgi:chemotaxis protein methyltransferase CheR
LGDEKAYLIETRLTKLMAENGCEDFGQFYSLIRNGGRADLREKIVDAMTTNETLWFRDTHPFTILREKLLPFLAEEIRQRRRARVRIWSAACSTGQEPYSMAIVIREFCREQTGVQPELFEIVGTDISPSALFLAIAARYDGISISRGLSSTVRDQYFRQDGRVWVLHEPVKKMVTFKKFNLQDDPAPLGRFDVVFLRYVAIYFSDALKKTIFARLAQMLSPSGYLILGGVESLRGFSDAFELLSHGGGYYHRRIG